MNSVYDILLNNLPYAQKIDSVCRGKFWTMAKLRDGSCGIAMTTEGSSRKENNSCFSGLSAAEAAKAVKSWNFPEASAGMAAVNACYNTLDRMQSLSCYEPYAHYCTEGLDLTGKTVGLVGHLTMPRDTLRLAGNVFILEKNPQPGDYPDSACEYLLPKCDVILITGSSLINKTFERLLELSENAVTIVTGPTVPMCPELLDLNIQRLAGMVVSDTSAMEAHTASDLPGAPYAFGKPFLLKE